MCAMCDICFYYQMMNYLVGGHKPYVCDNPTLYINVQYLSELIKKIDIYLLFVVGDYPTFTVPRILCQFLKVYISGQN